MIVDPDFPDHWKTRTLVGLLGDEVAPMYVIRLWAHCQNRRQFQFDNISCEALKALCRFPGNANKLEASLATSGFVRRDAKLLVVVGWDEYNSSLLAAWENGKKGGRPPKKPTGSDEETQDKPTGSREEKKGIDEKGEDKKDPPKPPKGDSLSCQEFFDRWNKWVKNKPTLATCRKLTDKRHKWICTRLKQEGWLDDFREAVKLLPLAGDGWQPGLDWLIRNEHNVYRLLEGEFDWRAKDDPALQKLEKDKRKRAAAERQVEVEQQKNQQSQTSSQTRKVIDSILPQKIGSDDATVESSLLFGSTGNSSANGAGSRNSNGSQSEKAESAKSSAEN